MVEDPGTFDKWLSAEEPTPVLQPKSSGQDTGTFDVWASAETPLRIIVKAASAAPADLVIDDTAHNHTSDAATLTQAQNLSISDAAHSHTVGAVSLSQEQGLSIDSTTLSHIVDSVSLSVTGSSPTLSIASTTHAHTADSAALTSTQELVVTSATHGHSAESVSLVVDSDELPESTVSGTTSVSGSMLAVRFLEADITPTSGASADASESVGNLIAEAAGESLVAAEIGSAPEMSASTDPEVSVEGTMERYREVAASVEPSSVVSANAQLRKGVKSDVVGAAVVEALLGRKRPLEAAVALFAALKASSETGGSLLQDIYMQVTGAPVFNNDADPVTGNPGTWTVPVTLRRGGTVGTRIPTGAAVVKWGEYQALPSTDFTGGIILTSDLDNAPYVDVFTVFKNNAGVSPWDDAAVKPRVRMGNLKGVLGNSTDKWGIAMSTDLSSTTDPYIEASNEGLMIKDANLTIIDGQFYVGDAGETTYLKWDGTSLIIAGDGSGITNIDGGNITTESISTDKLAIGSNLGITVDALLQLSFEGPRPYNSDFKGTLAGHLGQVPTNYASAVFRQGKFGKAVQVAPASVNYVKNPNFEFTTGSTIDDWAYNNAASGVIEQTQDSAKKQIGYAQLHLQALTGVVSVDSSSMALANGETVAISVYCWTENVSGTGGALQLLNAATNGVLGAVNPTVAGAYERLSMTYTNNTGVSINVKIRLQNMGHAGDYNMWFQAAQMEKQKFITPFMKEFMPSHDWDYGAGTITRPAGTLQYDLTGTINQDKGSIQAWIYIEDFYTDVATYHNVVWTSGLSSTYLGMMIGGPDRHLYCYHGGSVVYSVSTLQKQTWYHVVMTYDNGDIKIYLNGVLDNTGASTPAFSFYPGGTLDIGCLGTTRQLNGYIDEVIIDDDVWSAALVSEVYNSNLPIYVRRDGYDLYLSNSDSGAYIRGKGDGIAMYDVLGTEMAALALGGLTSDEGEIRAGSGIVKLNNGGIEFQTINSGNIHFGPRMSPRASLGYYDNGAGSKSLYLQSDQKVQVTATNGTTPQIQLYATNGGGFDSISGSIDIGIDTSSYYGGKIALNGAVLVGYALSLGGYEYLGEDGVLNMYARSTPAAATSGYGKLYWSNTSNWPLAMTSGGVAIPLGVAEVSPSIGDFVFNGASLLSISNQYYAAFRDGFTDTADTNIVMPYGWNGRTLYCDLIWWAGANVQNVFWVVEARYQTDNGALQTAFNHQGSAIANANNVIKRTTITVGTLSASSIPAGLALRVWRYGTNASDTYTGSANLLAVRFYVV